MTRGPLTSFDCLKKIDYAPSAHQKEMVMGSEHADVLQGTLEMLVLRALALEPMHGWGLAQRIDVMSRGVFAIQQGTLYPALQRMKRRGWVTAAWRVTENNRRARYYAITTAGERRLAEARSEWERTSSAVNGILEWRKGTA
jgi:transcriptional regulator